MIIICLLQLYEMIDLNKQKLNFKSHVATFSDYGNIKILDFKKPNSSEYRIRFLFEEDYYRLHISGDLGELIATNCRNMTYEDFSEFVNDVGYFESKIDCHSRPIYVFDEDAAKEDLRELFKEDSLMIDTAANKYLWESEDEQRIDDAICDILVDFSETTGMGSKGLEELSEYILDPYEAHTTASRIGKRPTGILNLYMLAFKLAQENLKASK